MSHKQLQAGEHLRRAIVELAKAGDLLAEDPEVRGSRIHYSRHQLKQIVGLRDTLTTGGNTLG